MRKQSLFAIVILLLIAPITPASPRLAQSAHSNSAISFTKHAIDEDIDYVFSVDAVDLDEDGDTDLVGGSRYGSHNGISWWENDGNQGFTRKTITETFSNAWSVQATDINLDGDIDVVGAAEADKIAWWENDGSENFTGHLITSQFDDARSVHATDIDGNGTIDIVGAAYDAGKVSWWRNDGSQNFTEYVITQDFSGARSVHAADLDDDGDIDIIGAAVIADAIKWWKNDGNESFTECTIASNLDQANTAQAVDIDNDGDLDVLGSAQAGPDDVVWFENNGSGNFTKHAVSNSLINVQDVSAVDLDDDGDIDIVGICQNSTNYIVWLENNGSQNFVEHVVSHDTARAHDLDTPDLDGDGDIDVVGTSHLSQYPNIAWWESNASDFGAIDGHVRYFGPPGIFPLANVQVSVDPPRTDSMITDANGEFSLDVPQDTYVVTGTTEGYVVASSVEARTVTVTPGETAWVGFTMIDESGASGCWTPTQACANEIANIIPILGLGSEVTGVVNGLCEVGRLWEGKRYLWSVTTLMATLADIADVVLLDIPTFDWLDALAECGVHQFRELTKGWSISKIIESIWQSGAQDSDVLVIGVKVEANNSVAAQASSASATLQVHLYSGDNHLGLKPDGTLEHTIPHSFLFEWPDNVYEVAIVKDATAQYELQIEGQSIATYNLSVINPRSDGTSTLVSYKALTVNDSSIASLTLGQSTTDFTLEVDTDGDGDVDEYVSPDSTERVWPANIYLPLVLRNH